MFSATAVTSGEVPDSDKKDVNEKSVLFVERIDADVKAVNVP